MGVAMKVFSSRTTTTTSEFIGEKGRIFYDDATGALYISDGSTVGGIAISGGSGGSYTLPNASHTTLGGVKVDGTTITITNGVISATQQNLSSYVTSSSLTSTLSSYVTSTSLTSSLSSYVTSSSLTSTLSGYVTSSGLTSALSTYALSSSVPTNTNQLTNGSGYITDSALDSYVTLTGTQTLTNKTLTSPTITDGVFQNTFSIGTQTFYTHPNGFSVNENFDITDPSQDPANQTPFTGYHYTSGSGKTGVAFTLARTGYFTDGFGITGDASNNNFVIGSETANTDYVFKTGIGMPFDVSGGTTIFTINRTGTLTLANGSTIQDLPDEGSPQGVFLTVNSNVTQFDTSGRTHFPNDLVINYGGITFPDSSYQTTAGMIYQGFWDASTNTPTLSANQSTANRGDVYIVNTAGTLNIGAGSQTYYAGDLLIYNGTHWDDIPGNTGSVTSFNTRTGAVTLTSSDVTTALGFTPIQLTSLSASTGSAGSEALTYNNSTGQFTLTPYLLPTASTTHLGGVKVDGTTITINGSGVISSLGTGTVIFKGTWNASTNTSPTINTSGLVDGSSPGTGWEYLVSATGTINIGAGSTTYYAGDLIIYDGTKWNDIPGNAGSVVSFNTRTGAVTLTSSDVTTALGFTPIQLSSLSVGTPNSASGSGSISYSNTTGVFKYTPPVIYSTLATLTDVNTSGVTNNQVLTYSTASSKWVAATPAVVPTYTVSTGSASGGGSLSLSGTTFTFNPASIPTVPTYTITTGSASGGGALSLSGTTFTFNPAVQYTLPTASASVLGGVKVGTGLSIDSGTGILSSTITQYTDALARAAISAGTGISYNNSTGVISSTITQYTDALARGAISVSGSLSYNSSTGVISYTTPTYTVSTTTASGGGSLSLSGTTFTFAPASIPTYTVSTASASGGGSLSLSGTTFTFTPPNLSSYITTSSLSVTTNSASGGGSLSYSSGVFTFTPTDKTSIVNGSYSLSLASNGIVTLPNNQINTGSNSVAIWSSNQASVVWRGAGGAGQPLQSAVNAQSGNVTVSASSGILGGATTSYAWVFDNSGSLTFPDASVQTTAYTGNAATATKLATARNINGVAFDGTAAITVTADATTLTGATLKSTVVNSSLTSVGTLTGLTSSGTITFTDTTNSQSTTTGALQVRGGVGVAGNIYLGGGINATGSIYSAGENVTYAPVTPTGQAYQATGKDTQGGTGYFDFFKINNTTSGVTNGSKTMRLNSTGTLEILNSAYNATILSITDTGFIAINAASGVSNGVPANNAIAMNSNSYIYDDGNYHLTSKSGSIWINANDGSAVNINTQMPSGITGGGLNVQGAVKSYGAGGAATAFISSGASLVSGVALQLDSGTAGTAANMAIRDTSTVASTMYFDVSTGSTPNGTFKFRSSSSFNELLVLNNTNVTVNKQMLIGGGSQTAYVSINSSNSYNISGSYGYLSGGGAGSIGSGGSTGTVGFSLYCSGRIQSNEIDVPSDERLKDIQGTIPLDKALQFVRAIDGILYTWKPGFGDEGLKSGFGAQSVYKAGFDHMVVPVPNDRVEGSTDADGFTSPDKFQLTLNYMEAIPYHHEVIKHLLDRIEKLETTIAKLQV